ncbi:MAG: hypothetical protein QOF25_3464 [Mycobacterium sp.]|nr:hypothetical protein [Mycobacterium sp.]
MRLSVRALQTAGVVFISASAIAIAPAVTPPPPAASWHTVRLVAEAQPLGARQEISALISSGGTASTAPAGGLVDVYDAVHPWMNYGAALALWAGRFLPVPGSVLYHSSVAYTSVVDVMTSSVVHNFEDFVNGTIRLDAAMANIGDDLFAAVVDFATTELLGHSGVVPPAGTPDAGFESWVHWVITTAISPLYYLPVPNAVTIDQLSFVGQLVGTVVSSAITNFGQVANGALDLSDALTNISDTLNLEAIPQFLLNEQMLFSPPALPDGSTFSPAAGLTALVAALQALPGQIAGPTLTAVTSIADRTSSRLQAALDVIALKAQVIGGAIARTSGAIGAQLAASAEAVRAALAALDPGRLVNALGQGIVDTAIAALGEGHVIGDELQAVRTDVAAVPADPPPAHLNQRGMDTTDAVPAFRADASPADAMDGSATEDATVTTGSESPDPTDTTTSPTDGTTNPSAGSKKPSDRTERPSRATISPSADANPASPSEGASTKPNATNPTGQRGERGTEGHSTGGAGGADASQKKEAA